MTSLVFICDTPEVSETSRVKKGGAKERELAQKVSGTSVNGHRPIAYLPRTSPRERRELTQHARTQSMSEQGIGG